MALLSVHHHTRYDYESPVVHAHHVAHLQPLQDAAQRVDSFSLNIDPAPTGQWGSTDVFGNQCLDFELQAPHRYLAVHARSRLWIDDRFAGLQALHSPPWEMVRAQLQYGAGSRFHRAVEFVLPSAYVPRLIALRDWAQPSLVPGRPLAAACLDLMHRLHVQWAYQPNSTAVETPLAAAFAQRAGVCQDFAHLLIGGLRMHGLAARYVSGYLLTTAAPGSVPQVGADASHAWVQVWCPNTPGVPDDGWLDLDPTNDLIPARAHARVAVGRDFGDVTPLRGVIRGGGRHTLSVAVTTHQPPAADDAVDGPGSCVPLTHEAA